MTCQYVHALYGRVGAIPTSLVNQTVFRERACASERGRGGRESTGSLYPPWIVLIFYNPGSLTIVFFYWSINFLMSMTRIPSSSLTVMSVHLMSVCDA